MKKIICQGAEALLIKKDGKLIKERIRKKYRYKSLDEELRKKRTRKEAKLLKKAAEIINVPEILKVDENKKQIIMKFIPGEKLSESLDSYDLKKAREICRQIGKNIALLHDSDIIHGDLTTSNMILYNNKVYFIDFGLGFNSKRIEDKAVDLHLLKQAFKSKHFKRYEIYFNNVLRGYAKSQNSKIVIQQLKKVESRGRYKKKNK